MTRHVNNRKHILETIHNWSAGCPYAHALWCRPFGVHLKVLQRLRTCQFLWLLLRVEEHRTRHRNGMGKRETLSLIYDKCM